MYIRNIEHRKRFLHWTHLFWNLAKIVDEANGGIFLERIIDAIDVNIALVKQMMEHIDCLDSCWPLLFVPKYQIYPLMEVGTHIVTLQGLDRRKNTECLLIYGTSDWFVFKKLQPHTSMHKIHWKRKTKIIFSMTSDCSLLLPLLANKCAFLTSYNSKKIQSLKVLLYLEMNIACARWKLFSAVCKSLEFIIPSPS